MPHLIPIAWDALDASLIGRTIHATWPNNPDRWTIGIVEIITADDIAIHVVLRGGPDIVDMRKKNRREESVRLSVLDNAS